MRETGNDLGRQGSWYCLEKLLLIKLPCPPQSTIALVDTHPSDSESTALTSTSTNANGEYSGVREANRLGEVNVQLKIIGGDGEFKDSPEEGPRSLLGVVFFRFQDF